MHETGRQDYSHFFKGPREQPCISRLHRPLKIKYLKAQVSLGIDPKTHRSKRLALSLFHQFMYVISEKQEQDYKFVTLQNHQTSSSLKDIDTGPTYVPKLLLQEADSPHTPVQMKNADCKCVDRRTVETIGLMMLKTSPNTPQSKNCIHTDQAPSQCLENIFLRSARGVGNIFCLLQKLSFQNKFCFPNNMGV